MHLIEQIYDFLDKVPFKNYFNARNVIFKEMIFSIKMQESQKRSEIINLTDKTMEIIYVGKVLCRSPLIQELYIYNYGLF